MLETLYCTELIILTLFFGFLLGCLLTWFIIDQYF